MLFGTPEYMSPEQARGDQVDHRVDVYAMGCILFQLVTNRVPFEADNFMGVLSQHLTAEPPQIAPETFDQIGAPRALEAVIDKALEKDRNKRWQTIEELANAVRQVSGDPLPADKSQPIRAASVPAPGQTTRARPPTGTVEPLRGPEATGRIKTQWTGNLTVPEVAAEAPREKKKSALPLILGGVAVAAIGAVVAVVMLKKETPAPPPVTEPQGSAVVVTPPPPPPQVPQEPPLPDMVTIKFESTPKNAEVIDMSTNKTIGKTPYTFIVPGSKTARQFKFHLKGYGDSTVELVPNRAEITYTQPLQKGATQPNVVTKLPDSPATTQTTGTTGAVTKPDTTTTTTTVTKPNDVTTKPDTTTPDVKPPDVKPPDVKPPDTKPPGDDCPGDEPCLKVNIPGMGSNK
jgi:serine/threonine-protein kinase